MLLVIECLSIVYISKLTICLFFNRLQLMNSQGLLVMDLRHTLPNLKYLILALISTSNQQISHFRKFIPHICTMPNHTSYEENNSSRSSLDDHSYHNHYHYNNTNNDSNNNSVSSSSSNSIGNNSNNSYSTQNLKKKSYQQHRTRSKSPPQQSFDSGGASKRSLAIPIPKSSASEAHRPRTGFGVGVT